MTCTLPRVKPGAAETGLSISVGALGDPRHAQPRLVQLAARSAHSAPEGSRGRRRARRSGRRRPAPRIGGDVVMGGADAARGEDMGRRRPTAPAPPRRSPRASSRTTRTSIRSMPRPASSPRQVVHVGVARAARQDLVADHQHRRRWIALLPSCLSACRAFRLRYRQAAMRFPTPSFPRALIRRYKRFLADVVLEDGRARSRRTAPTPARCWGWPSRGSRIWLEPNDDPRRKLGFGWRLVELPGGHWPGIDTAVPNRVVAEALRAGRFRHAGGLRRGPARGSAMAQQSRVDFLLTRARAAGRLCRGEERPPAARRATGRVPRLRHRPRRAAPGGAGRHGGRRASGGDALPGAADRLRPDASCAATSTRPTPRLRSGGARPGSRRSATARASTTSGVALAGAVPVDEGTRFA